MTRRYCNFLTDCYYCYSYNFTCFLPICSMSRRLLEYETSTPTRAMTLWLQAGRFAAAHPASHQPASSVVGVCGGPQTTACFLRRMRQPAWLPHSPPSLLEQPAAARRHPLLTGELTGLDGGSMKNSIDGGAGSCTTA